ncbi:MFS transporter [Caldovatus aquaticus]|uniref:MFS transporter n=1 Tax=Caldovatus aquaticus TaxID=2865671 RepID=A0ABS7F320_9PROT|nr:MFS transporter [Caldovatus aquaticus]MBW8269969.1 MFS transporter [Caldovatus aquaticus]
MAAATRRLILVVGSGAFAGALATRVTDPLVGVIAGDLGVPVATAALLASAYALPLAGVQPVLGPLADSLGKRRVMAAGLVVMALALAASALAPGFGALFAARMLAGAGSGATMPLAMALIGDTVRLEERQVALSRLLLFAISGQVAGGAVAGVLEAHLGWRGVMALCAAVALLAAWVVRSAPLPGVPETAAGRFSLAQALGRYRTILANRAALELYAAVALEGAVVFGSFPFFAALLAARGIGGVAEAGLAIGAFGAGGFVYAALARPLLARCGQARMVRAGGALGAAALLGLAAAPAWWGFAAAALALGVGFYMVHGSIQTRVTEVAPAARASAMALHACGFFVGQSLGPVLFGAGLRELGAGATLALFAAALAGLGLVLGRRPG